MANDKRLVDVNPLIERFSGGDDMKSMAESLHDSIFVETLRNAPTVDAVEVVRCPDCVYCEKELGSLWCCKSWNRFDSTPPYNKVSGEDYCSRGERRTNHGKG